MFDPHLPYSVKEKETKEYFSLDERKGLKKYLTEYKKKSENNYFRQIVNLNKYIFKYDTEIRSVDDQIRILYNLAEKSGLNKNGLWIITSDHGEGMGQHDNISHGRVLYQEAIKVPLIFYFTEKEKNLRYTEPVENFDIFSTLIDITGKLENRYGQFYISSKSQKQIFESGSYARKNSYAFSERRHLTYIQHRRNDPVYMKYYSEGKVYSLQNKNYKFIYKEKGENEFYDLKNDPYELVNIIVNKRETIEFRELKGRIIKLISNMKNKRGIPKIISREKAIKKIKTLGYIL